jgi:hypothetical protein
VRRRRQSSELGIDVCSGHLASGRVWVNSGVPADLIIAVQLTPSRPRIEFPKRTRMILPNLA